MEFFVPFLRKGTINFDRSFMKRFSSVGVFLVFLFSCVGLNWEKFRSWEEASLKPWAKAYSLGISALDPVRVFARETSGGYLISGAYPDSILAKIDKEGNVLWSYRQDSGGSDTPTGLSLDTSGIYLVGSFNTTDSWYLKSSSDGSSLLWQYRLTGGAMTISLYTLFPAIGGGFLLGGEFNGTPFIGKIDSSGGLSSTKNYMGISGEFRTGISTSDGGYLLGGLLSGSTQDILLVKTFSNGSIEWGCSYDIVGGTSDEVAYKLYEDPQGGYLVVGYISPNPPSSSFEALAMKIDSTGGVLWIKSYGESSVDMVVLDIADDGSSYLLIGENNSTSGVGGRDFLLLKIHKSSGDFIEKKSIGTSGDDSGRFVLTPSTGGYFIGGVSLYTQGWVLLYLSSDVGFSFQGSTLQIKDLSNLVVSSPPTPSCNSLSITENAPSLSSSSINSFSSSLIEISATDL